MSAPERAELQRLRYWQGQMLRTRDFRDQAAIEAQLRWWHNRALHNTSGIVKGLNVTLPETQGKRSVTVSPGLAYDCFGRELIQCYEESIPVPAASEPLTLLVRYKDVRVYPRKQDLSGVCVPGMVPLFKEKLEFIWKPSGKV